MYGAVKIANIGCIKKAIEMSGFISGFSVATVFASKIEFIRFTSKKTDQ